MPRRGERQPLEQRLWARVTKQPNGCWLWTGHRRAGGYGAIWFNGGETVVHRLVYELMVGPVPPGRFVCHRCDVRACVNPEHLFLGTAAENSRDMVRKGRSARGERVRTAKLTLAEVRALHALSRGGMKPTALSKRFGISTNQVWRILRGKNWRHGMPLTHVVLTLTSP